MCGFVFEVGLKKNNYHQISQLRFSLDNMCEHLTTINSLNDEEENPPRILLAHRDRFPLFLRRIRPPPEWDTGPSKVCCKMQQKREESEKVVAKEYIKLLSEISLLRNVDFTGLIYPNILELDYLCRIL